MDALLELLVSEGATVMQIQVDKPPRIVVPMKEETGWRTQDAIVDGPAVTDIDVDTFGSQWRRRLQFHIPVRVPELWNDDDVNRTLRETLEFLSDDFYEFKFYAAKGAPELQGYFECVKEAALRSKPEQVMMFSGGLDSLAGAVDEILVKKQRVMLVNHESTPKFNRTRSKLDMLLAERAGELKPSLLKVRVTKDKALGKGYTQRSRSFLYASLGATVARMLGLRRLRFYENGVLSINLPVCTQVIGSRATRTTHPKVIAGFQSLLSLVAGETFTVETPFVWDTKGDVVKRILQAGCGHLIVPSRSCAHTWESTNEHTHCGVCSQCIDRRVAVIAAKAEDFDPMEHYKVDVFTESLGTHEDKIFGASYIERANKIRNMKNVGAFISRFPEVMRAIRPLGQNTAAVTERVFDLYRRHAAEVKEAIGSMLARHAPAIIERTLPGDCLLRTVYESGAVTSLPAANERANINAPKETDAAEGSAEGTEP